MGYKQHKPPSSRRSCCRFNPQPFRRRAATVAPVRVVIRVPVSILSSSEEGPQRLARSAARARYRSFNPRPSEEGLQRVSVHFDQVAAGTFQSSAPPKKGCNPRRSAISLICERFQSSAPPKRGCNSPRNLPHRGRSPGSICAKPRRGGPSIEVLENCVVNVRVTHANRDICEIPHFPVVTYGSRKWRKHPSNH